jgi:hypothetical protein
MRREFSTPQEIADELRRIGKEYQQTVVNSLLRVIDNPIMSESAEEVPVRTGDLRRSGTNQEEGGPADVEISPGRVSVTFGYGKDYGIYVHENLNAYHTPPKKAKFLEDPVNRHIDTVAREVENDMAALVEGGG